MDHHPALARPHETNGSNNDHRCFAYTVDADDVICSVNDAWRDFAVENDEPGLADRALGKSLWDFIQCDSIVMLHTTLLERVRTSGLPLQVPFRCDSPTERRFMHMTMTLGDLNRVNYQNRIVRVEPRNADGPLKALFTPAAESDASPSLHRICSWCKRAELPSQAWVEIEEAIRRLNLMGPDPMLQFTHTACPSCHDLVLRQVRGLTA